MKLANVAVQVATVKTGNTGKLLTVYQGDQMIHKGSMVDGLNDNWDYANKLKADRQAKQNRGSNQFPYVYTKLKTGKKGLIFLDPVSGKERFDIVMEEKDPNYIVDEIDGIVFIQSKSSLKAVDVK